MTVNLKEMSLSELRQLADRVAKAIGRKEKANRKEALAAVEKVAREFGVDVSDLVGGATATGGKRKRGPKKAGGAPKKGKPRFANPDDKSQTWTGKGRRPAWYVAAIDAGKSPDEMAI